ncbi:Uncharacterized protein YjbI, contains pentapeptide repeats [Amycolatopsis pretoriensis]|uniref:Uncharacterized protein YjbI, contains pentapeptide repeats n=2 Tax=Amycolatopsis pretoriensis TaxID=218821 RepID=A0A1H5RHM9_9PSEU|nr:Uncharacterized protein YjbI, contains pentapeptide repeats [Amycolatopsis pretoriensis]
MVATAATGLAAVGAFYVTSRTLDATRQQTALNEQGQYTDRFGRAVEQLGSEKLDIRLGGIYALERLAKDSARDTNTIMRLLSAYVRENTSCPPTSTPIVNAGLAQRPPVDVAAALTVLSARDVGPVVPWADVTGICLDHRNLETETFANLNLDRASLAFSNMRGARFRGVRLQQANLRGAGLPASEWLGVLANDAQLDGANLTFSILHGSSFTGASLVGADLGASMLDDDSGGTDAPYADATLPRPSAPARLSFHDADLTNARFTYVRLASADFSNTSLNGADFTRGKLENTDFSFTLVVGSGSAHGPAIGNVRFDAADLTGASFRGRDMRQAHLVGANLTRADLRDTDLRGVDLRYTTLTGANLQGAKR